MSKQDPPFGERFKDSHGAAEGLPSDLAAQHDHYRLGTSKKLPTFTDYDERVFVVLTTSKNLEHLRRLADEIRKRIYGDSDMAWAEHLEDVLVRQCYDHELAVLESDWQKLPEKNREFLVVYCQGFVEAGRE